MKKKLFTLLLISSIFSSCGNIQDLDNSNGTKCGTLQKISHKRFPFEYYSCQIGFQSGVSVAHGESLSYTASQDFTISKEIYDSMRSHVGEVVVFEYEDRMISPTQENKLITSIKLKK